MSHQTLQTECASLELQEYSLRSVNFSVSRTEKSNPKNLSELIEFSPLGPLEIENITIVNEKMKQESNPKIMTFKLKTHVMVENKGGQNQTTGIHSLDEKKTELKIGNVSEDPLSDIEYLDPEKDESIWGAANPFKWKFRSRVARMKALNYENDSGEELSKSIELRLNSDDSKENKIDDKQISASGRQFLFHPYLPYGKDVSPDEKISFHDILPVKMVKFIKSMVEEAPWEQMFMKMVRMIVDQFVDKIIEKMFADKDHHSLKRSFDVFLSPTWTFPTFQTPILRLKRSINTKKISDQEESLFTMPPPKKLSQDSIMKGKKSPEERMSWLDHFLDFVFPNSKSNMSDDFDTSDRLKKRDTSNIQLFKSLVAFFLNTFEKSSGFLTDAKDILRYKMLKEFLPYLYQKRYANTDTSGSSNSLDMMKMSHRKFSDKYIKRNDILNDISDRSERHKRSARSYSSKEEDEDDDYRLWQSSSRKMKPIHQKHRDECSLRKACNAGRLLSRLPSVHDVTLQLR